MLEKRYLSTMIAHATLAVSDYEKAKGFYRKALAPAGYMLAQDHPEWKAGGFMEGGQTSFWIGQKDEVAPSHIAFEVKNKNAVDDFYNEALAAGGKDNGAPGYRRDYWPGYYAAFVLDGDGNNLVIVSKSQNPFQTEPLTSHAPRAWWLEPVKYAPIAWRPSEPRHARSTARPALSPCRSSPF